MLYNDSMLFHTEHSDTIQKIGHFGFGLSGSGEPVLLYDETGRLVQSVIYNDLAPWPLEADGLGYTLELDDFNGRLNDGSNWFAGCPGGSPGRAYFTPCSQVITLIPELGEVGINVFPNPFSSNLYIDMALPETAPVSIEMFDLTGRKVATIFDGTLPGREHTFAWKSDNLTGGVYFLKVLVDQASVGSWKVVK